MKNVFLTLSLVFFFASSAQGQMDSLAVVREVDSLISSAFKLILEDRVPEAISTATKCVELSKQNIGEKSPRHARALYSLGVCYSMVYDVNYPKAEAFLLTAKEIQKEVLPKNHIDYAKTLVELGVVYTATKRFDLAESNLLVAREIFKDSLGIGSAEYLRTLTKIGNFYFKSQEFEKADSSLSEAKNIWESMGDTESRLYASSIALLGSVKFELNETDEAEKLLLRAKEIRKRVLGVDHYEYDNSLLSLGMFYYNHGRYAEALPYHLELVECREKRWGKNHMGYARALSWVGSNYTELSRYEQAESYYKEAMNLSVSLNGKNNSLYSYCLRNLGINYEGLCEYEEAFKCFQETADIVQASFGKQSLEYATALLDMAISQEKIGNFATAESLYLDAISIQVSIMGEDDFSHAQFANSLGILYQKMGLFEKAEMLSQKATLLWEKTEGKESLGYLRMAQNLANVLWQTKRYEDAEKMLTEIITTLERLFGIEHPETITAYSNLAIVYDKTMQYQKAEILYRRVVEIQEKLGKEYEYADAIENSGAMFRDMKRLSESENLLLRAQKIRKRIVNSQHHDYIENQINLILLYVAMRKLDTAEDYLQEVFASQRLQFVRSVTHLSNDELTSNINLSNQTFNLCYSIANDYVGTAKNKERSTTKIMDDCYDYALFRKGYLLIAANRLRNIAKLDTIFNEKYIQFLSLNRQLSQHYSTPNNEQHDISQIENKANALEKELTRSVAGFGQAIQQVNWQEVQASLKPAEAAIEFVHYRFTFPKETDSILYAALLLKPGLKAPLFIPLFEEKQLDSLFRAFGARKATYANALYGAFASTGDASGLSTTLYQLLWQPLVKALEGVTTIYYSPSGLLHRLNIGAIPVNENAVLADRYQFVQLGSTRQLVVSEPSPAAANATAALFGGIQYEMDSTAIRQANISISTDDGTRGEMNFSQSDSTLRGGSWNYLKRTAVEVDSLALMLQRAGIRSDVKKGYAATEEAFKQIGKNAPSPHILHIATHGFFFPDPKTEKRGNQEPVFKISDNPMIRAGLVLAGANHAWKTGRPHANLEDGILTAYEISQLDLRHTDLVVLSACETGLGDIAGNEGVYGLQRAFKIAGAKHLVMSLWQVPDYQTQELMTIFYQKMLSEKMPVREALQAAQKTMREKNYEPYYWAGFVLIE